MRRILSWASWLIMAPLFGAAIVFALNNKSLVALDLWPFGLIVELPIYLAMYAVLGLGILMGGVVAWLGQGRVRSNLRGQAYEGEVARRKLQAEREKTVALKQALSATKSDGVQARPSPGAEAVLAVSKALPPHPIVK